MGAACMALKSDESLQALCDRVCTPGGTTIEAVKKLRELDFEDVTKSGAKAAIARADEMSSK
jgi:pyrroline-5-carboxylate reductase